MKKPLTNEEIFNLMTPIKGFDEKFGWAMSPAAVWLTAFRCAEAVHGIKKRDQRTKSEKKELT